MADDLSNPSGKIIFFDGECNLCSKTVVFLINNHEDANFKFASLQSNAAASLYQHMLYPTIMIFLPKPLCF